MNDQVETRKIMLKTDFAYTRWYRLPKGHTLHVVWQNDTHVKVILTKVDIKGIEGVLTQGTYRYDSMDLENHIIALNKYLRKILNS